MPTAKSFTIVASGDTTLLSATTDGVNGGALTTYQFFRIHSLSIITNGSVVAKFYSGPSSGADLKYTFDATGNAANTGISSPFATEGLISCAKQKDFVLNLSAGVSISVNIDFSVQGAG